VSTAPPGFDARFAASWRRYVYRLSDAATPYDPLLRHLVTRLAYAVDLDAMNSAGTLLLGYRDFGAFCRQRAGATTLRTLLELAGTRVPSGPLAGVLEFTVRADAFCHSMVRSLIGALVEVGSGRRDPEWLAGITRAAVRDSTVVVLPPGGLTLEEVGYPEDSELTARVRESRTVREVGR
jgi:tRNA pseudouridine38-40 synthase